MGLMKNFKNAWNAFTSRDPTDSQSFSYYPGGGYFGSARPDRIYVSKGDLQHTVDVIYNKIAVDISNLDIHHVRTDEDGNYKNIVKGPLDRALSKEANIDQTGRELIRTAALIMFEEGCVAIVPTVTDVDPNKTDSFKVEELRAGSIRAWYPDSILVEVYNDILGVKKQIKVSKRWTCIIENPFYTIMNERNSVGKRLLKVQRQLDKTNDTLSSGKLDMIIQVPYSLRKDSLREKAEKRRKDIEFQLSGSELGIAYIDSTEKFTQLNRPLENNLWNQAKELQQQLYNELGFTQAIFDGTADEKTILNYRNQTLEPILNAFVENMERKWLSKTAITQGQAIRYFSDPFKLIPIGQIAEIADKFTRNEIATANEIRSKVGFRPADDPKANELRNSNINHPDEKAEIEQKLKQSQEIQNDQSKPSNTQNGLDSEYIRSFLKQYSRR